MHKEEILGNPSKTSCLVLEKVGKGHPVEIMFSRTVLLLCETLKNTDFHG